MAEDCCNSGVVEEAELSNEAPMSSATEQEHFEQIEETVEQPSSTDPLDEGELPEEGEITDEEEEGAEELGAASTGHSGTTPSAGEQGGGGGGGFIGRPRPQSHRSLPYFNSNRGGRAFGTGVPAHFQHRPPNHSSSFASRNSQPYPLNSRGGGDSTYDETRQQSHMRRFGTTNVSSASSPSSVPSTPLTQQASSMLNNSWRSSSGSEERPRHNLSSATSVGEDSLLNASGGDGDQDFRSSREGGGDDQDSDHRINVSGKSDAPGSAPNEDNDFRATHFFDRRRRHNDEFAGGEGGDAQHSFKRPRPSHFDGGGHERGENPTRFYQPPQHNSIPHGSIGGGGVGGGPGGGRFRPHWAQRTICKFFREGFCRDGDQCTYSHNATDSHRRAELCKFYQHGYCKKGLACMHLHGEYPCKAFHKGECSKEQCQYSHQPLNDFTRPIFEQMLRDEELASQVSMPAQPMRRKVLLPQGPTEPPPPPLDQSSTFSSTTQVYGSIGSSVDVSAGVGGIPPPSVVVPSLSATTAGPPPANFGFFNPVVAPGAPHSTQQLPPVSMSVPPPTIIGMPPPQNAMAFGGIGLNSLTHAPPPPPVLPTSNEQQRTMVSPPKQGQPVFSTSLLASKGEDDEEESGDDTEKGSSGDGGGGFSIAQMLEQITQRGAAASREPKEEINDSPASPPPASSLARIEKKMKVIPVATSWRLIEVDVDADEQLNTAFDSLKFAQKISSSGLTDPRLKRLAQKQFDLVSKTLEQQSVVSGSGSSGGSSKKSVGAVKTPVDPRKKAHEQQTDPPSERQLVQQQIQMASQQQQQQQLDVDHRGIIELITRAFSWRPITESTTAGIAFPPPSAPQQAFLGGGLGIQVPPPNFVPPTAQPFSPQFPPPALPPQSHPAFSMPPPNIVQQQAITHPQQQQLPSTFMPRGAPPTILPFQQPPPSQPPTMQILPSNHGSAGFDSAVTAAAPFGNNVFGRGTPTSGFDNRPDSSAARAFRPAASIGRNDEEGRDNAGGRYHHRDHGGGSSAHRGGSRHYSSRYHNHNRSGGGDRWEDKGGSGGGGGGSPSWRSRRSGHYSQPVGNEARSRNRNNNNNNNNVDVEGEERREEPARRSYSRSPRNGGGGEQENNKGDESPSPDVNNSGLQQSSPSGASATTPAAGGEAKVSMREKRRNNEYESPLAQV